MTRSSVCVFVDVSVKYNHDARDCYYLSLSQASPLQTKETKRLFLPTNNNGFAHNMFPLLSSSIVHPLEKN